MLRSLSPEQRLIVDCIRRGLGLDRRAAHDEATSWEVALQVALEQGVAPLVASGLAATGLPSQIRTRLRAHYLAATVRAQNSLEPVLRRALSALRERGLDPIALKGAALAYQVYPEPAHRTMGDVDLLVPVDQIGLAARALEEQGLWTDEADIQPTHHLRPFHASDSPVVVELHHSLLIEPHPFELDLDAVVARSTLSELAGLEARVLAPADALHLACLHLAYSHRYQFFPLRHLVDILAITARSSRDLDWDLLLDLARRSRTAGAVYWPLELSRAWLGALVPAKVLAALAPPPLVRRLVTAVAEPRFILSCHTPTSPGGKVLHNLILNFSLHTGCPPGRQAVAALQGFFPPSELIGHLPPDVSRSRFRYAAYLLRPTRLARGLVAMGRVLSRAAGR